MSDPLKEALVAIGQMMNNLQYVQMLLGLAVSRIPDGFEVGKEDYNDLVGKGLVLQVGERPGSFRLVLKELPDDVLAIPNVSIVGEA